MTKKTNRSASLLSAEQNWNVNTTRASTPPLLGLQTNKTEHTVGKREEAGSNHKDTVWNVEDLGQAM
ncbi:hypothetical protein Y1Q_0002105 [Alligator mississippiensis]|uniref:Uncharacterized protein n=1 Tax=Alligator mississippiensis TaxID=8496 RepID=A0A151MJ08_ALLMI|nr:hypothetical protein Y1Q_0002105 [Alligator mississippiensis]